MFRAWDRFAEVRYFWSLNSHLEKDFNFERIEAKSFADAGVSFEEGAGGDATSHPLQRDHRATLRHKVRIALLTDKVRLKAC